MKLIFCKSQFLERKYIEELLLMVIIIKRVITEQMFGNTYLCHIKSDYTKDITSTAAFLNKTYE